MRRTIVWAAINCAFLFCTIGSSNAQSDVGAASAQADMNRELSQLARLQKGSAETAASTEKLLFQEVPNTIEALELQKAFAQAGKLAETKLDAARTAFGGNSASALDALQDLIFLKVQQHDEQGRKRYLAQYAELVNTMRGAGESDVVDRASRLRRARLQSKLEAAARALKFE